MNRLLSLLAFAFFLLSSTAAFAEVRHEGTWPVELKHISIDAKHVTRTEAIMRVAKEAGWSVVVRDVDDGTPFDVHVTDQPADKVLDVVLGDGDFVAKRDGTLITISGAPHAAASAVVPPPPPAAASQAARPPPAPSASALSVVLPRGMSRGEDRVIRGGDLVVGADETVHDVTVFGGSVEVLGTATGNVTVLGGSAHIKKGAHVFGSATAVGGSIDVADGAQVDGDVGVVGGSLHRHKGAKIGGTVHKRDDARGDSTPSSPRSILRRVSDATTRAAMLFVFGAVLFALAGNRMNALRVEAASRPMRSFALGIVGGIVGIAAIALIAITIVGIPVAIVLLLGGVFAAYAGICAVLATLGKALIGHKTDNPHVHLLVGCAIFLVSGAIPFVSGLVTLGVVLTGIGVIVATRAAGTVGSRSRASGPYRTEANPA
jgi:hypothetical protein